MEPGGRQRLAKENSGNMGPLEHVQRPEIERADVAGGLAEQHSLNRLIKVSILVK
jgi:hypothetical protein